LLRSTFATSAISAPLASSEPRAAYAGSRATAEPRIVGSRAAPLLKTVVREPPLFYFGAAAKFQGLLRERSCRAAADAYPRFSPTCAGISLLRPLCRRKHLSCCASAFRNVWHIALSAAADGHALQRHAPIAMSGAAVVLGLSRNKGFSRHFHNAWLALIRSVFFSCLSVPAKSRSLFSPASPFFSLGAFQKRWPRRLPPLSILPAPRVCSCLTASPLVYPLRPPQPRLLPHASFIERNFQALPPHLTIFQHIHLLVLRPVLLVAFFSLDPLLL